jgi:hypothetical protein
MRRHAENLAAVFHRIVFLAETLSCRVLTWVAFVLCDGDKCVPLPHKTNAVIRYHADRFDIGQSG